MKPLYLKNPRNAYLRTRARFQSVVISIILSIQGTDEWNASTTPIAGWRELASLSNSNGGNSGISRRINLSLSPFGTLGL